MKLPYIKAYKDRHGRARYYFRRKGFPSVQLEEMASEGDRPNSFDVIIAQKG